MPMLDGVSRYIARGLTYKPTLMRRGYMRRRGKRRYSGVRKALTRRRGYYRNPYASSLTQELKFFDSVIDDASVASTGTVVSSLNLVAQGITEKERIGRKIIVRSIACRFTVNLPGAATLSAITASGQEIVRIILYIDSQCNGANAAVLDLLETADYTSYRNLANKDRFTVLMDRSITLKHLTVVSNQTAATISIDDVIVPVHYYKGGLAIPIEFDSTAGAITEVKSYNIGLLYISKNAFGVIEDTHMRIRFDG